MASFPGGALQEQRESLGLSFQDVFRATRIPIEHLRALEEGRLSQLPGPTYTLGFIQTYCQYLDLNPHYYMDRYRACLPATGLAAAPTGLGAPSARSGGPTFQQPAWLADMITWGAICGALLVMWLAYSVMVRPLVTPPADPVEAAIEVSPPEHHFREEF